MTIEEAIEILRKNRPTSDTRPCGMELCDAVDMAISALRHQDVADKYVGKMTNAQKIRAMNDEELAEFLDENAEYCHVGLCKDGETCRICCLRWLQMTAEEDDHAICGTTNLPCIRCNPGGCDNRKEGADNDT